MATIIVQTGAEALEIITGSGEPDRLEPNAHRVVELGQDDETVTVRRVPLTDIETALLGGE